MLSKRHLAQSGFSILEVMLAMGVAVASFMYGTETLTTRQKISQLSRAAYEAEKVKGILEKVTSVKSLCKDNLGGKTASGFIFDNGIVLKAGEAPVLEIGKNFDNGEVRVDDLRFRALNNPPLDLVEGMEQKLGFVDIELSWLRADRREETRVRTTQTFTVPILVKSGLIEKCQVADHVLSETLIDDDMTNEMAESACSSIERYIGGYAPLPEKRSCQVNKLVVSGGGPFESLMHFYRPVGREVLESRDDPPLRNYPWRYADSLITDTLELPITQMEVQNGEIQIDPRTKITRIQRDEEFTAKVGPEEKHICFEDGKGCPKLRVHYTDCQTVQGPMNQTVSSVSCPAGKFLVAWWRNLQSSSCTNYWFNAYHHQTGANVYSCDRGYGHQIGYSYIKRTPTSIELRFRKNGSRLRNDAYNGQAMGQCCRIERY